MSDYPMLISNKLHSFRNFVILIYMVYVPQGKIITAGFFLIYYQPCPLVI